MAGITKDDEWLGRPTREPAKDLLVVGRNSGQIAGWSGRDGLTP